jgi:uncharacterized membrane protein (DUF2068 family)
VTGIACIVLVCGVLLVLLAVVGFGLPNRDRLVNAVSGAGLIAFAVYLLVLFPGWTQRPIVIYVCLVLVAAVVKIIRTRWKKRARRAVAEQTSGRDEPTRTDPGE